MTKKELEEISEHLNMSQKALRICIENQFLLYEDYSFYSIISHIVNIALIMSFLIYLGATLDNDYLAAGLIAVGIIWVWYMYDSIHTFNRKLKKIRREMYVEPRPISK